MKKLNSSEMLKAILAEGTGRDDGYKGKTAERVVRAILSGRLPKTCKAAGKVDCTTMHLGKRVSVEIKTACSDVMDSFKAAFVMYCPEVDEDTDLEEQFAVFTQEAWREMLNGYTGRGSLLREPEGSPRRHIQSFRTESRPKASKPIAEYLWNACLDQPSLAEWLEEETEEEA